MSRVAKYLGMIGVGIFIGVGTFLLLGELKAANCAMLRYKRSSWILICMLFMSLLSLGILRAQANKRTYYYFKIYLLGQATKAIVILGYVYLKIHAFSVYYEGLITWGQTILIDFVCVLFSYSYYKSNEKISYSSVSMLMCYMISASLCTVINSQTAKMIYPVFTLLGIGLWCVILIIFIKENRIHARVHSQEVICYFIILLIQYVLNYILGSKMSTYYTCQYSLLGINSIILFISVYSNNIKKPHKIQTATLSAATKKLDVQMQTCEKIVSLSHELKTPVNVIRSALTILSLDFKEEQIYDEIKIVKVKCQFIMNIIQDMINIQKLKQGILQEQLKNYNVVELIENVVDAFAEEKYPGRMIFDPEEEEIFTQVDREMCEQCFMLLLGSLLQENDKEIEIKLYKVPEARQICILLKSEAISTYKAYIQRLDQPVCSDDMQIDKELTMQLFMMRLEQIGGQVYFVGKEEDEMLMILSEKDEGEQIWIEPKEVQELKETIACRYGSE